MQQSVLTFGAVSLNLQRRSCALHGLGHSAEVPWGFYKAQDEYHDSPGSVVAADFYHSNVLMGQTDADIVARVQRNVETCEPGFRGAKARPHSEAKGAFAPCTCGVCGLSSASAERRLPRDAQRSAAVRLMICTAPRQAQSSTDHTGAAGCCVG